MKKNIFVTTIFLMLFVFSFATNNVLLESVVNDVGVGETLVIKLEENGSTGFIWNYSLSNPDLVKLIGEKTINPNEEKSPEKQMSGAPYFKEWTFKVNESGEGTIIFSLYRPWEDPDTAVDFKVYNLKAYDSINLKEGQNTLSIDEVGMIELDENPSTGYSWTYNIDDSESPLNISKKIVKSNSKLLGASNKVIFEISSSKSGTHKIILEYKRPWEDDPIKTFEYDIEVVDSVSLEESQTGITKDQLAYIELYENPTTGYTWNYEITNKKVLEFYKKEMITDENSGTIGVGSEIKFSFEPILEGKALISFKYYRNWENPEKSTNIISFNTDVFFVVAVK